MSASSEVVTLPADLHARPAGLLARSAAGFQSAITLTYGPKTINPASVLQVMSLGAKAGTDVTITADGPDAPDAVATLVTILNEAE